VRVDDPVDVREVVVLEEEPRGERFFFPDGFRLLVLLLFRLLAAEELSRAPILWRMSSQQMLKDGVLIPIQIESA